jgi:uncharacterized protein YbjT (DUF2867 family)
MPASNTIAVVGATGAQGGGLARSILEDPSRSFSLRAITRNRNAAPARALAQAGAEVVEADLDDLDSLKRAFAGAHGAFCVTFFWAHFSPERELAHARNMAEAAKSSGLQHVIWSTLEDTRRWIPLNDARMPTLQAHYKVPHFDAKGEANELFRGAGVPTTFLLTSFYWDNLIHFGMGPRQDPEGNLVFSLPMADKKLPGISADDIGGCAFGIFKNRSRFIGKTVGVAGEHLTGAEMAAALTRALGRQVRYQDVPPEVYRRMGFPGAEDLGNMFQFKRDFEPVFCGARSVQTSRQLHPALQTFDQWLARHKDQIPIP